MSALAKSPDDRHVAVGYLNGSVRIFSVETGECRVTFNGHRRAVRALNYDPHGVRLVSGGAVSPASCMPGCLAGRLSVWLSGFLLCLAGCLACFAWLVVGLALSGCLSGWLSILSVWLSGLLSLAGCLAGRLASCSV